VKLAILFSESYFIQILSFVTLYSFNQASNAEMAKVTKSHQLPLISPCLILSSPVLEKTFEMLIKFILTFDIQSHFIAIAVRTKVTT
jgi:hypothetical protein